MKETWISIEEKEPVKGQRVLGYSIIRISVNNKGKTHPVHQLVAMAFLNHKPCSFEIVVDHIDNHKTNNKVDNLQLVTNRQNTTKTPRGFSKYIGVYFHANSKRWYSQMLINGKNTALGRFDTEIEAHNAYQNKLKEITI